MFFKRFWSKRKWTHMDKWHKIEIFNSFFFCLCHCLLPFCLPLFLLFSRCTSAAQSSYARWTIPGPAALRVASTAQSLHLPTTHTKERLPFRRKATSFPRGPCGWRGAVNHVSSASTCSLWIRWLYTKEMVLIVITFTHISEVTVSQGLNLNLVIVASCLLAAVAIVCGLIAYRSSGASSRCQLVSSHEFWACPLFLVLFYFFKAWCSSFHVKTESLQDCWCTNKNLWWKCLVKGLFFHLY